MAKLFGGGPGAVSDNVHPIWRMRKKCDRRTMCSDFCFPGSDPISTIWYIDVYLTWRFILCTSLGGYYVYLTWRFLIVPHLEVLLYCIVPHMEVYLYCIVPHLEVFTHWKFHLGMRFRGLPIMCLRRPHLLDVSLLLLLYCTSIGGFCIVLCCTSNGGYCVVLYLNLVVIICTSPGGLLIVPHLEVCCFWLLIVPHLEVFTH